VERKYNVSFWLHLLRKLANIKINKQKKKQQNKTKTDPVVIDVVLLL